MPFATSYIIFNISTSSVCLPFPLPLPFPTSFLLPALGLLPRLAFPLPLRSPSNPFKYFTKLPCFMYGLTKNHGGSPKVVLAPYNSRTFTCFKVFHICTSRTNTLWGAVGASTLIATVRLRQVPRYTSEKNPIPIFSSRSTSYLRGEGKTQVGENSRTINVPSDSPTGQINFRSPAHPSKHIDPTLNELSVKRILRACTTPTTFPTSNRVCPRQPSNATTTCLSIDSIPIRHWRLRNDGTPFS